MCTDGNGKSSTDPCFNLYTPSRNSPFTGSNFHFPYVFKHGAGTTDLSHGVPKIGSLLNLYCDIATYFESLISINQDIHLKLQQQRLITMGIFNLGFTQRIFDKSSSGTKIWGSLAAESNVISTNLEHQIRKPKSISYQNLNSPKSKAFRNSSNKETWSTEERSASSTNLDNQIQKQPSLAKEWYFDNCYVPAIANNEIIHSNGKGNGNKNP